MSRTYRSQCYGSRKSTREELARLEHELERQYRAHCRADAQAHDEIMEEALNDEVSRNSRRLARCSSRTDSSERFAMSK